MVAHGYGIAATGSLNLIFPNVLWGYLVRLIPEINGVLSYSIATLSVFVFVGTVVIYGLCRYWFFVDLNIANPSKLKVMLDELGSLPTQGVALVKAWFGVQTLWHPTLFINILTAFVLALLRPSWHVTASWGLCIAAVFGLCFLGRPGILRVNVPLVCLLLVAPLLNSQVSNWCKRLAAGMLFVAAVFNTAVVFSESRTTQTVAVQVRQGLIDFPGYPVVGWGATKPSHGNCIVCNVLSTLRFGVLCAGTFLRSFHRRESWVRHD